VGFHPVAVALHNNTQIKHITNRIQITDTSNINTTQNTTLKKRKGSRKRNVTKKNCVLQMLCRAAPARTNAPEERAAPTHQGDQRAVMYSNESMKGLSLESNAVCAFTLKSYQNTMKFQFIIN
jgi:hypothetical protein